VLSVTDRRLPDVPVVPVVPLTPVGVVLPRDAFWGVSPERSPEPDPAVRLWLRLIAGVPVVPAVPPAYGALL